MILSALAYTIIVNFLIDIIVEQFNLPKLSWFENFLSFVSFVISLFLLSLINRDHGYERTIAGS